MIPACRCLLVFAFILSCCATGFADEWPQWLGPKRDGVWRETGILSKFPAGGPKVRCAAPVGPGYGGPAVVGNKVFVMDRVLDEGVANPKRAGFSRRDKIPGKERILCLDETNGKVLWEHKYPVQYNIAFPSGPRVTPLVHEGKVYTLGAMGDLFCLDAATGKPIWAKNFVTDFAAPVPLYGWGTHAVIDGKQLICLVGGKGTALVSFDKDTGKELWRSLSTNEPGYSAAIIRQVGAHRQLIAWHGESVNGLDLDNGKPLWSERFQTSFGMAIPTPVVHGDRVFINAYFGGCKMIQIDPKGTSAKLLWKINKGSCMATPIFDGDFIYGVDNAGALRCLKADTGDAVWTDARSINDKPAGWGNVFLIPHEDKVWLANEHGDLILAKLSPRGYQEITRARILAADNMMAGRNVVWSHPAFAHRSVYARNDSELVCISLQAEK